MRGPQNKTSATRQSRLISMTSRCNTDTRCRSPINGLAGRHRPLPLHRPPLRSSVEPPPVVRSGVGPSHSGRKLRPGWRRLGGRAPFRPGGQMADDRAALREPIDHRLDSASSMPGGGAGGREARWYSRSAFGGAAAAVAIH